VATTGALGFRGRRVLGEDGVWRDGSAAPQLLPARLRVLPGELVTRDPDDGGRAHEIDPPHVVKHVAKGFAREEVRAVVGTPERARAIIARLARCPTDARVPVTQRWIDIERFHAIRGTLRGWAARLRGGEDLDTDAISHLWFAVDDARKPSLRAGPPPPSRGRPRWLKGKRLVVDVWDPPGWVCDELLGLGYDFRALIRQVRGGIAMSHSQILDALGLGSAGALN
jgi:hypothetical protein